MGEIVAIGIPVFTGLFFWAYKHPLSFKEIELYKASIYSTLGTMIMILSWNRAIDKFSEKVASLIINGKQDSYKMVVSSVKFSGENMALIFLTLFTVSLFFVFLHNLHWLLRTGGKNK